MSTKMKTTKVITGPNTLFSYLHVLEPIEQPGGGNPKYSVCLIISKDDVRTLTKISEAVGAAYEEGQSKLKGNSKTVPPFKTLKTPMHDGDLERPDDEAFRNSFFLNATSSMKPGIVDADLNEIIDPGELYSGIFGRASINFYAFNTNGNKGIACGLNNLQKLRDGTPLGGHTKASVDFADLGDDDDDFLQ